MPAPIAAAIPAVAQKMGGEHHLAILHIEVEAWNEFGDCIFGFVTHIRTGVKCEV